MSWTIWKTDKITRIPKQCASGTNDNDLIKNIEAYLPDKEHRYAVRFNEE